MSRREFLHATAGGSALVLVHPFSANAAAEQAHLRLMETTDLHVHVFPYDYYADKLVETVGLARTATHVAAIRAEATNTLLLDNGDFLQGNPMGDYIAYERGMKEGDLHPVIAAMNALGYDASTLGNHEFNYGLDFLMKSIARAEFPIVSANVVTRRGAGPTQDTTLVPPYVILDRQITDGTGARHLIKIGLIGFAPPQIMIWDRRLLEGRVSSRDIVAAARAWVPVMKEQGADIVIALSHSGIGASEAKDGMENASTALALVDGIDAILTGHTHQVFPSPTFAGLPGVDVAKGTLHGKPATMGGFWGSHLGVIDLLLERDGAGWRVAAHGVETRPISRRGRGRSVAALVDSAPGVLEAAQVDHDATLAYVRRAVGRTAAPLHSYFALVADDPSVRIVNQAQRWYVERMMKGTPHEGLPILSAAAPFKAGGLGGPDFYTDVPVGNLAIKHISDLYLYPNTVHAVRLSGAQVREWLERSAGQFHQILPGVSDQPLLDPDFPSYNFDVIDGVTYRIDLSQPSRFDAQGALSDPAARRIVDLAFEGQPVTDGMAFIVVTNNYRSTGGGIFPGATGDTIIFEAPDTTRDVLVRYVVEQGTIHPKVCGTWAFAPMPGASAVFETGPGGLAYAAAVPGVTLEPMGDGDGGFVRFRLLL